MEKLPLLEQRLALWHLLFNAGNGAIAFEARKALRELEAAYEALPDSVKEGAPDNASLADRVSALTQERDYLQETLTRTRGLRTNPGSQRDTWSWR